MVRRYAGAVAAHLGLWCGTHLSLLDFRAFMTVSNFRPSVSIIITCGRSGSEGESSKIYQTSMADRASNGNLYFHHQTFTTLHMA